MVIEQQSCPDTDRHGQEDDSRTEYEDPEESHPVPPPPEFRVTVLPATMGAGDKETVQLLTATDQRTVEMGMLRTLWIERS